MNLKIYEWYARLGNNINQLLNVILIGLHFNWNIIIPKHKMFNTTYIVINKNIKNIKSVKICSSRESKNFFTRNYKRFKKEIFCKNKQEAINILKKCFIISDVKSLGSNDVLIHLRGGDIFGNKPHPKYVQPPLFFYKNILNNNKFDKIYLISQDTKNPVLNKLLKLYPNIIFKKNNLIDDIKLVLGSKNIIDSFGTFIPSLINLSNNIEKVYKVNYQVESLIYKVNKNIKKEIFDYNNYKNKIGKWENKKSQNKLMLTYKK